MSAVIIPPSLSSSLRPMRLYDAHGLDRCSLSDYLPLRMILLLRVLDQTQIILHGRLSAPSTENVFDGLFTRDSCADDREHAPGSFTNNYTLDGKHGAQASVASGAGVWHVPRTHFLSSIWWSMFRARRRRPYNWGLLLADYSAAKRGLRA